MILPLFRRRFHHRSIRALYGAIVAQARSPAFYADFGVPDTLDGRFDLIVLHLVLLLRRLEPEKATGHGLGQELFDTFCRDLDDNLREMGVGDLAVPKKMRQFAEAFYGRQVVYVAALAAPAGGDFEKALARNIYRDVGTDGGPARLARYARAAVRDLESQDQDALVSGEVVFPDPKAFADARA
jgi:cytochrome b pre-mRNA-processing protein 3